MSLFLALIHGDEAVWDSWGEAEGTANAEAHARFNQTSGQHIVGGHELQRTREGRVVRLGADGTQEVVSAPFVSVGGYVLGGFYVLEARDLEEAVELARQLPEASAPTSAVEVRPVATP